MSRTDKIIKITEDFPDQLAIEIAGNNPILNGIIVAFVFLVNLIAFLILFIQGNIGILTVIAVSLFLLSLAIFVLIMPYTEQFIFDAKKQELIHKTKSLLKINWKKIPNFARVNPTETVEKVPFSKIHQITIKKDRIGFIDRNQKILLPYLQSSAHQLVNIAIDIYKFKPFSMKAVYWKNYKYPFSNLEESFKKEKIPYLRQSCKSNEIILEQVNP